MKRAIAIINPVLVYTKYLLLAASLLLSVISIAQFFKLDINLSGNVIQTIIPFLAAASVSMLLTKKVRIKKR